MPEYGFSMTCIIPYKDRIFDSVLIREYTGQRKPVLWHILGSDHCTFQGQFCIFHVVNMIQLQTFLAFNLTISFPSWFPRIQNFHQLSKSFPWTRSSWSVQTIWVIVKVSLLSKRKMEIRPKTCLVSYF